MPFDISYPGAFLAGLISFLSPCVLPLVPPYLCYLAGTSLDQLVDEDKIDPKVTRRVIFASLIFVAGFSTVFIALGAGASFLGKLLNQNLDMLAKVGGVIIILFGLHFLGLFKLKFLMREARFQSQATKVSFVGAYVMGLAFAFGWTPCVGPVLAAILFIAGSQDTISYGISLLTIYSLGLGVPFVAAAFGIKGFMSFMARFRRHMATVEKVMGVMLVLTGVLFLTGAMNTFSYWLLELFPILGKIG
ncbi:MAG TPA: cytochrome c biogenesis protein CcdA [Rhodobacteraceae bacterium]|nr:cytochrome c biogenesis protein CcdA [Paracoccaceae bacterium]